MSQTFVINILGNGITQDNAVPDIHPSTPQQLALMGFADTSKINKLLKKTFSNVLAQSIDLSGLTTTVTVANGELVSTTRSTTGLSIDLLNNDPSNVPIVLPANFDPSYQNTYEATWSENAASVTGFPVLVNVFDLKENSLFQINQDWSSPANKVAPQSFKLQENKEVPPNSQIRAILQADIVIKRFKVLYAVSLSGVVASNFNPPLQSQTVMTTPVLGVQLVCNLPTYVVIDHYITITVYENPCIKFQPYNPN